MRGSWFGTLQATVPSLLRARPICPSASRTSLLFLPTPVKASRLLHDLSVHNVSATTARLPLDRKEENAACIARQAARGIREAIASGSSRDAFSIYNRLHSASQGKPWVSFTRARFEGVPYSPLFRAPSSIAGSIPTRLASHALLHGLVRAGLSIKASNEAEKLIKVGMSIRLNTLQTIVDSLCAPLKDSPASDPYSPSERSPSSKEPSERLDKRTRSALILLAVARRARHRRSQRMYKRLIDACLLQGEIITACLLFVLLVRDWQIREVLKARASAKCEVQEDPLTVDTAASRALPIVSRRTRLPGGMSGLMAHKLGLDDPSLAIPYPTGDLMIRIINSANLGVQQQKWKGVVPTLQDSHKALDKLADLLEEQALPFSNISSLIKALSSVSRCDMRFYQKSHRVLFDLAHNLPSKRIEPTLDRPSLLPPVDGRSYHALIHYALRHRLSPALANRILEHMTTERHVPLHPDIWIYNTILRSATLARRNDIVTKIQQALLVREENKRTALITLSSPEHLSLPAYSLPTADLHPVSAKQGLPSFTQSLHTASLESLTVPQDGIPMVDGVTLAASISHLTSTGRPHVIAELLPRILPELCLTDRSIPHLGDSSRREYLKSAVARGPYFYCAILNALCKAGHAHLVQRVWKLAKIAERESWSLSSGYSVEPWLLPIHGYTIMMQMYAREGRKGLIRTIPSTDRSLRRSSGPRTSVRVWARESRTRFLRSTTKSPWEVVRDHGLELFVEMRNTRNEYLDTVGRRQALGKMGHSPRLALVPVPDARFYNACLRLFTLEPPSCRRSSFRKSPSYWRKRVRLAEQKCDSRPNHIDRHPALARIAKDMVSHGYPVPLGVRRILADLHDTRTELEPAISKEVRPLVFPPRDTPPFEPFKIPALKTRGLPLRRAIPLVGRKRRWRRAACQQM